MPPEERKSAVALGVQLPGVSDEEHASSLAELARLGKTLGVDVVVRVTQRRAKLDKASVVGEGKLRELAGLTGGSGIVPIGPPGRRGKVTEEPDADGEAAEKISEATDAGRRPGDAPRRLAPASCSSITTSRPRRRETWSVPPRPRCSTARP